MGRQTDLTCGNIKKQLVFLAIPLILGNILQQLYNAIDAIVVGRFAGETAFAAIGVSGTVMNLFIFIICGCCTGIAVLFAQFYGSRDMAKFRRETFLSITFGGAATLVMSVLAMLLLHPLLRLIQTPADVAGPAIDYLRIIICGLLPTYFYNLCSAALRSIGNTRMALLILAAAMLINLLLDLLFVAVFGMGIKGAAYATVFAQLLSAVAGAVYWRKRFPHLSFKREDMRYDGALLKATAKFGMVSALHQSSLYIGKLLVQGAVNSAGTDMISAYTATSKIEGFANSFGDSGAESVSIFVAQNVGHGDRKRAKKGFFTGMCILILLGVVMSVIMRFTAQAGIRLMTGQNNPAVLENGAGYMEVISLFYVLCFMGNALVGYFRGSGRVIVPVCGTILHISLRVILSYLLIEKMGLRAVAVATGFGWITVVLFQSLLFALFCRKEKEQAARV